ncbi:MAG: serine hydrolase domain-containing protein [Lactobacillus sp.]|nr:serine hydrolase domain-containing protein [Lactobacillus sp.]
MLKKFHRFSLITITSTLLFSTVGIALTEKSSSTLASSASLSTSASSGQVVASSTSTGHTTSQMQKLVKKTLEKYHLRGRVTTIENGKTVTTGYGYAWLGKKYSNTSSKVVYPTGSLSKVITAAIMVQLINSTKHSKNPITQNSKVSRWYPNLKNSSKITIGNLLTHTSGITTAISTERPRSKKSTQAQAVAWTINQANYSRRDRIGTFNYTNANYIILAGIITKVTGKSFAANVKSRIIKKLGLKNTYFYSGIPKSKTDPISYTYKNKKNYQSPAVVNAKIPTQIPGAGSLFTTPNEYMKIITNTISGKILNQSDFKYLTNLKSASTTYSGGVYLKNSGKVVMAYGNLYGVHFANYQQIATDGKNGIVMLLNQSNDNQTKIKQAAYEILKTIKSKTFIQA